MTRPVSTDRSDTKKWFGSTLTCFDPLPNLPDPSILPPLYTILCLCHNFHLSSSKNMKDSIYFYKFSFVRSSGLCIGALKCYLERRWSWVHLAGQEKTISSFVVPWATFNIFFFNLKRVGVETYKLRQLYKVSCVLGSHTQLVNLESLQIITNLTSQQSNIFLIYFY